MWGGENVVVGGACKGEGHTDTSLSAAKWGVGDRELCPGRSTKTPCQLTTQGTAMAVLTPHPRAFRSGELCVGLGALGWL